MKLLISLAAFFLSIEVYAEEINVFEALKSHLGSQITKVSETKIMFCPDQKCEIFRTDEYTKELDDYVYLYLFHTKEYISVYEFLEKKSIFRSKAIEESEIRKANKRYCFNDQNKPLCILKGMKNKLNIEICRGNHDEGHFCTSCSDNPGCTKL